MNQKHLGNLPKTLGAAVQTQKPHPNPRPPAIKMKDLQKINSDAAIAVQAADRAGVQHVTVGTEVREDSERNSPRGSSAIGISRRKSIHGALIALGSVALARIDAIAIPSNGIHDKNYTNAIGGKPIEDVADPWNFLQGECTSYVAFRLNANGISFHNYYGGGGKWGHASNWLSKAKSLPTYVEIASTPAKGDVAWTSKDGGHVAIVEELLAGGKIRIAEYNYSKQCFTNDRKFSNSSFTYLRFKASAKFYLFVEDTSMRREPGSTFDFGRVKKARSENLEFTIENVGSSRETVSVTVSGTGFSLDSKPSSSLSGGRSTDFEVEFNPRKSGNHSGKLTVKFAGKSYDYNLVGTGT